MPEDQVSVSVVVRGTRAPINRRPREYGDVDAYLCVALFCRHVRIVLAFDVGHEIVVAHLDM